MRELPSEMIQLLELDCSVLCHDTTNDKQHCDLKMVCLSQNGYSVLYMYNIVNLFIMFVLHNMFFDYESSTIPIPVLI